MKAINLISQDLFDKVRSRFSNLEMGDETGAVTIDPTQACFFDFDFVLEGNNLGRVSISLNDSGSLKIYYSQGITENQDDPAKQEWYDFLREMRKFAMRRLLRFDTRDIAKSNLNKNDFKYLAATGPKEEDNNMNESKWNQKSTKKTSRAINGSTEVIVRHAKAVDEEFAGSRSQRKNIKAIFIQNKEGERYKYPFNHTAGAFAMAQHVDHGGVPHDPAGKAIIGMSENIAQLQEFQRQVQHTSLHADAQGIAERAVGRLQELKGRLASLSKRHHYETWMSEFAAPAEDGIMELDAVTMEEYKTKFSQTNFKEALSNFFPLIHSIMQEVNTIDLEEYVEEGIEQDDECDTCGKAPCACVNETVDDFAQFEEWADSVEQGKLTNDQIAALKTALAELQSTGQTLQLGPDGQTAWSFFNELGITDSDLEDKFADMANIDPETDALQVFQVWASTSYPELAVALGMSNASSQEATPQQAEPEAEMGESGMGFPNSMMSKEEQDPQAMIKEVAGIVKSFYNKDNPTVGPFRGEEGIAIDVQKTIAEKFGDDAGQQARMVAEKFMEKLTGEWQARHGGMGGESDQSAPDEMSRFKKLVGNIKGKVEGIGDQGRGGQDYNTNIMSANESADDVILRDIRKLSRK